MIVIKDFEMPKKCIWDCPLCNEEGGACQLSDVKTSDVKRPSDCPLVEAIPKADLKIILNRLKARMKDRDEDNGGEPLNAVDGGYHLAYEHLCEEIDNLLKENKDS